MDTSCKSESQKFLWSSYQRIGQRISIWGGMQSVSLLAQSFCRSITRTAEQDPSQNTVGLWFEMLS